MPDQVKQEADRAKTSGGAFELDAPSHRGQNTDLFVGCQEERRAAKEQKTGHPRKAPKNAKANSETMEKHGGGPFSRVGEEDGLKGTWPMTVSPYPSWEPDVQISRIRLVWKLSLNGHSLFP